MLMTENGTEIRTFHDRRKARTYVGAQNEITSFVELDEVGKPAGGFLALHDCAKPGGALRIPWQKPNLCRGAVVPLTYRSVRVSKGNPAILEHHKGYYPHVSVIDVLTSLDITPRVQIVHIDQHKINLFTDVDRELTVTIL